MTGVYKIAGKVIQISSVYEDVHTLCKDYACGESAELKVVTEQHHIENERKKSYAENIKEGIPPINYPDGYLETLAVYRIIADNMPRWSTLLFHGSAIAVDGEAYLFTAKSGTGKSTHTRLWRELFGDRAVMINDDKPLIRFTDEGAVIYGTPWNGKHRLGENISAPLKAVCVLERGKENRIVKAEKSEVYHMLLQQTHRPCDPAMLARTLMLLDNMGKIGLYKLSCNMDISAAQVAYNGMR